MAGGLPPHLYLEGLKSRNEQWISDEQIVSLHHRISEINRKCRSSNVVPLYTLAHLAMHCDIPSYLLDTLTTSVDTNYKTFEIHRRSKNKPPRIISEPSSLLKMVQSRILRMALPSKASQYSYAYSRGMNTRKAVEQHVGAAMLISLDIKDFFNSCNSFQVQKLFKSFGYPKLLSLQLASLTTRGMNLKKLNPRRPKIDGPYLYQMGCLPQGASTSGMVANLLLTDFDDTIADLISPFGGVYTRYADDLQISFPNLLDEEKIEYILSSIRDSLRKRNFFLNDSKTRIQRNPSSLSMLGFSIDKGIIRVNAKYRSRVKCLLRAVDKYGLDSFVDLHPGTLEESVLATIEGHFIYISGNDAYLADEIRDTYHSIMKKYRFSF